MADLDEKEIIVSKNGSFPMTVKFVNERSEVEAVYRLIRTNNGRFMLQK